MCVCILQMVIRGSLRQLNFSFSSNNLPTPTITHTESRLDPVTIQFFISATNLVSPRNVIYVRRFLHWQNSLFPRLEGTKKRFERRRKNIIVRIFFRHYTNRGENFTRDRMIPYPRNIDSHTFLFSRNFIPYKSRT